jgi:hypothetical protein
MLNTFYDDENNTDVFQAQPKEVKYSVNLKLSDDESKQVIQKCREFKTYVQQVSSVKKESQLKAFSYLNNKSYGNDLLPKMASKGKEVESTTREPVFMPVIRQQIKQLYAQTKMTLFPSDDNFMRVISKTKASADVADDLTEGLRYVFRQQKVSETLGKYIFNLMWASGCAAYPCLKDSKVTMWEINPNTGQAEEVERSNGATLSLDILDPFCFYIDPFAPSDDLAKWVHCGRKSIDELKRSEIYYNTEDLEVYKSSGVENADNSGRKSLSEHKTVAYDLYYFPVLELESKTYRNMLVGVVANQEIIRFSPNLTPNGKSPIVYSTWMQDAGSLEGTSPAMDLAPLQRLVNILMNHQIDTMARIGNKFVVSDNVDTNSLFGEAGGIVTVKNGARVQDAFAPIAGDYTEPQVIMNAIGVLKAEMNILGGGVSNPFQGASQVDYQKTATELQLMDSNGMNVLREHIEHISVDITRILEHMARLVAMVYKEPLEIRTDGGDYKIVDFSPLLENDFIIEIVNTNPAVSKAAQINALMQWYQIFMADPVIRPQWLRNGGYSLTKYILELQGEKNIDAFMMTVEDMETIKMQTQQGEMPDAPIY